MKIDSHQHYWKSEKPEPNEAGRGSRDHSYLPEHLKPLLKAAGIDKTIVVQASPTEEETNFLLDLAEKEETVAGVVGWLDVEAENFQERWAYYTDHAMFKGIRPMIQNLSSDWIVREKVVEHLGFLADQEFPLDLQANPRHLPYIIQLLEKIPHLRAVVDHLAKPPIEEGAMEPWLQDMKEISAYPNVMCKLSGMVPEKEGGEWSAEQIKPYAAAVMEAFGRGRVMFGSDWPVCLKSASHQEIMDLFEFVLPSEISVQEWEAVYGGNAARFYKL